MSYGKDGNYYFVNSGNGWGRDKVDETFGSRARADGSVLWDYVFQITGGAELIGAVTNRREIESMRYSRRPRTSEALAYGARDPLCIEERPSRHGRQAPCRRPSHPVR